METSDNSEVSLLQKILGWGVHLFTSMGMVVAAAIAVAIHQGGQENFRWAFMLMVLATAIDAVDGKMARAVNIKKVVPGFDGTLMDNIIDFITFTALPLALIARAGLLPAGSEQYLVFPLLASLYGFCQTNAKTEDGYFVGFPSYWNIVALYLWILQPSATFSFWLLMVLAVLTFVPSLYLYPSKIPGTFNTVTCVLGFVWGAALLWVLMVGMVTLSAQQVHTVTMATVIYPVYYGVASWVITIRRWSGFSRQAV